MSQSEAEEFPHHGEPRRQAAAADGESIQLPMKTVINCLPQNLQAQLRRPPGRTAQFILPLSAVLPQLCRGRVRVSFKEIKAQGPPETFLTTVSHDGEMIELPLQEILSRLKPEHMTRRPGQRRVEIPDDVISPFGPGSKMRGAIRVVQPSAGTSRPNLESHAASEPEPAPAALSVPEPSMPVESPRVAPAREDSIAETNEAIPDQVFTPIARTVVSEQADRIVPIAPITSLPTPEPRQSVPMPAAVALRAVTPVISPLAPEPPKLAAPSVAEKGECVQLDLAKVIGGWPAPIQAAVRRVAPDGCKMDVPLAELEPKIKQGRVAFAWQQLRAWLVEELPNPLTEHDRDEVELPLALVAPLFMARRRVADHRTKPDAHGAIPDVFAGSSRKPSPPPNGVAAHSADGPANQDSTPAAAGSLNGQSSEDKIGAGTTPSAIVNVICKLPGVGGAVIATQDGLLVAKQLPSEIAAEPIAAFLPQMFHRLTEYVGEMKMGSPTQFNFHTDGRVFSIYKTNENFLIILGRLGDNLPEAPIKALVARLNQPRTLKA